MHVLQTLSAAATGEVALRMALHDEREARQRADLEAARSAALARSLQASLLPPELPAVPGLEVAARYLPAAGGGEVVGDFFDLFQRGPDAWGFMIGDVAGKGVEAAKLATLARHTIRTAAMQRGTPREILLTLNQAMHEQDPESDRFVTAIYGTLEPVGDSVEIELSVAGHPTPLVRRADRSLETTASHGTVLGALSNPILSDESVRLERGTRCPLHGRRDRGAHPRVALRRGAPARRSSRRARSERGELATQIALAVHDFSPALADDTALLILRRV